MVCALKYGNEPRHRLLHSVSVLVLFALLLPGAQAWALPDQYAQADIEYGSQIYLAQCSSCHGVNGDSVPGVNFRAGQFKTVLSDNDLRSTITTGAPGTAMPPFSLNAAELAGIVAYVRNMGALDARTITLGDSARGMALFEGSAHCATCHRVNGKGPRLAPDLSIVGTIRTADLLERTLLDPNASLLPVNRSVRAVTQKGQVITGRRLNEDTYTVQLIDQQEQLVSLVKADLREYKVIMTSAMPSYRDKLSSKDIADLVAYLLSLKGSQ